MYYNKLFFKTKKYECIFFMNIFVYSDNTYKLFLSEKNVGQTLL